ARSIHAREANIVLKRRLEVRVDDDVAAISGDRLLVETVLEIHEHVPCGGLPRTGLTRSGAVDDRHVAETVVRVRATVRRGRVEQSSDVLVNLVLQPVRGALRRRPLEVTS